MFSNEFLAVRPEVIAEAIRTDGVFSMRGALSESFIDEIVRDVEHVGYGLNRNWISSVYADRQLYLCHMFAASCAFVRFATHPRLFEIFDSILTGDYRLKAHRYYETYGGHHMQWHTDNKTDRGFAHIPGLIVIAYVSDVDDGQFQYVRGSHVWSGEKAYNDYADDFVEQNFSKDILDFTGPKSTMVIYDTYGIHRAKPVKRPDFARKSLFFQVDCGVEASEPLLVNPEYIDVLDERTKRYLGFGLPSGYSIFPQTDLGTLPLSKQAVIFGWMARRVARVSAQKLPTWAKRILKDTLRRARA